MNMAQLAASVIFGAVGFSAFLYGKNNRFWRPMVIGVALMGFPYLVTDTRGVWCVGTGLTALLFLWRE